MKLVQAAVVLLMMAAPAVSDLTGTTVKNATLVTCCDTVVGP